MTTTLPRTRLTTGQIAAHRAAHTRRSQKLDEQVRRGDITVQQAAGFKANSKRRLNMLVNGMSGKS